MPVSVGDTVDKYSRVGIRAMFASAFACINSYAGNNYEYSTFENYHRCSIGSLISCKTRR